MPGTISVTAAPGQVIGLASSGVTSSTITISWQAPSSGGAVTTYIVQIRLTGTTSWTSSTVASGSTTYQFTALQPSTSYDIVVVAQNQSALGTPSTTLTVGTASNTSSVPPQVSGVAAGPTSSNAVQLTWSAQTGTTAATSFTVQYAVTGTSIWTSVTGFTGTGGTISALQAATSYDFAVFGVNATGAGPVSLTVTVVTQAVTTITWNILPSGTYTVASGTIGVNAHVSPATSPIQFGFSLSATTPPSGWTAGLLVNTDLWGAYVPTPATAGNWYAWAEGLDGSAPAVSPSSFLVQ
jgi:hypothetical protein